MRILVTMPAGKDRDTFIPPEAIKRIESLGDVIWNEKQDQFASVELKEKIRDMDVCITGWGTLRFDKDILEYANALKIIAHTGGTVAMTVDEHVYRKGIRVVSGNRVFAESVAEGTMAYILAGLRNIPFCTNEMHQGKWSPELPKDGLLDQAIGLVGFGMVAKSLANMLKPFRPRLKVFSPYSSDEELQLYGAERASLEEVFLTCKIISIHASKTPETYHMIGRELLQRIPQGAVLVNTSRGSLIDEAVLIEELKKGRFKVVLDVFETEPLPSDHGLLKLQNTILMPHMAGPTIDRRKYATLAVVEDIERFFKGEELQHGISGTYASRMTR